MPRFVPTVIEKNSDGERAFDIYSRLLTDRIIFLDTIIDDNLASLIISQLIFLANTDSKKDITLYINSPGGSISSGFAIHDCMNYIKPDITTICIGSAASMGAFLLASGQKGKRYALPNSEIMIHQPLVGGGGLSGQETDITIHANHLTKTKQKLNKLLAKYTSNTLIQIEKDTNRDNYLDANAALQYGIIDKIITKAK
jgi:ATP-dependent Clp protease protease subunit